MKAIAFQRYGGPEVLELMDLPEPPVGPDSVLIRTRAAALNPVDVGIREGGLDSLFPSHFPIISGWDVAGVVERVGPAVVDLAAGDEVVAYNRQDHVQLGTYAELVSAPRRAVARRPASVGWAEAAGLPLAGLTAFQALSEALTVGPGDSLLVHGASGGVGSMAVQIGQILGAEVIGTASEGNHDYLRSFGAEPLAYGDGLADRVHALRPDGVDAVLDLVGGDALAGSPGLLRSGTSRLASIVDPSVLDLGGRYVFVRPDRQDLATLVGWVDDDRLRVEIAATFPLERAADAQRLLAEGHTRGKIVLTL